MEKIGFFGGCFNPPNNLHIEIANNLIKEGKLDKIVFVPVNDYYKKQGLINSKHRYNMLKIAIQDYSNMFLEDIEIKENRVLYACDAFELIKKSKFITEKNKNNIYYILGSDNYKKMPKWNRYDEIKNKYNYIVINRKSSDISSSKIREMLSKNEVCVKKYLPQNVYEYIIKNKLYIV